MNLLNPLNPLRAAALTLLMACCALAQTIDPFPKPIADNGEPVRVNLVEFATVPDVGSEAARMMLLVNEPGTRRLFVNDMRGPLYTISYDGKTVTPYLDINASNWGSRRDASVASRASRSIRSSASPARAATASSTPTRIRATCSRSRISFPRAV